MFVTASSKICSALWEDSIAPMLKCRGELDELRPSETTIINKAAWSWSRKKVIFKMSKTVRLYNQTRFVANLHRSQADRLWIYFNLSHFRIDFLRLLVPFLEIDISHAIFKNPEFVLLENIFQQVSILLCSLEVNRLYALGNMEGISKRKSNWLVGQRHQLSQTLSWQRY